MTYLVTGGTGFIGSYTVRDLIEQDEEVVAFDFTPSENSIQQVLTREQMARVKIVQGDVGDPVQVFNVVKQHNVDMIVHLAYLLIPASYADPSAAVRVNCVGQNNIFEAARAFGVKRVVWASSVAVFGPADRYTEALVPDSAPHYPTTVYGACKSLNEFLARHFFDAFGLDNIGLRFTIVYGVGRMRGGSAFATQLIQKPALGEPSVVIDPDGVLDWQYVEDVSRSIVAACKGPKTTTRVFNTGGIVGSTREAVGIIRRYLPEAQITLDEASSRGPRRVQYDVSGIAGELDYRPIYSMDEGIKRTINGFRQQAGLPIV